MNPPISAVFIVLNEAQNIERSVKAAKKLTSDVVVMDTGSTDNTIELARDAGANVFECAWKGYGPTKNYAVTKAQYEWILSIDGDEVLSDELIQEIKELSLRPDQIYAINILTSYCGTWIKHSGWFPSFKKRIYHKKHVQWNDRTVHENLIIQANQRVIRLKSLIYHYSYPNAEFHVTKGKRYALEGAEELIKKNKQPALIKTLFGPAFRFFKMYVLKRGFLDGKAGFLLAYREAKVVRWRYEFYKKLKNER